MINCLDLEIEMTKTSQVSQPPPPTYSHPREKFYFVLENKTANKSPIKVNFGPKKFVHNKKHKTKVPNFNNDRKIYTPTFIHAQLRPSKVHSYNQRFERHVKKLMGTNKMKKPKPRAEYCQVCKEYFENYFKHISCEKHLEKVRNCWAHKRIVKICDRMDRITEQRMRSQKGSMQKRKSEEGKVRNS